MNKAQRLATIRTGVIAGAAGGLAELAWITLYAGAAGGDPAALARGVTTAAGVGTLLPDASPVMLGIVTHMALAVALGVALLFVWRSLSANWPLMANPYPFMLATLAGVWAINFLVVLPILSPSFIHLAPYAVSLTSKLLFGAAAAVVTCAEATAGTREARVAVESVGQRRTGLGNNLI